MNNIIFGLFLGFVLTPFSLVLFWNQWKRNGFIWPKTKEEKEKNTKSTQKIIPFAIIAVVILPSLINKTSFLSALISFIFFMTILSWKLDSYFRAKNKNNF